MKKVVIVYKSIPQYRKEFYQLLKDQLAEDNVHLQLLYGNTDFPGRKDAINLEWGTSINQKVIRFGNIEIIWQPITQEIKKADLVIVEQANKLLVNYYLIIRWLLFKKKFAFWGHGLNLQRNKNSVFNKLKRLYSNRTSWWFAYTEGVKNLLINNGFPSKRITVVQNAFDTKQLRSAYLRVSSTDSMELKRSLAILDSEIVFIYCGALYKEKRIDLLINTADNLAIKGLKFKLIILGGGEYSNFVKEAAEQRNYIKFVGPTFGIEKAKYFSISDISLMPGAVGLTVLDSFVFETPMVITKYQFHGPEFEYIKHNKNGIVTEDNEESFVNGILELTRDKEKLVKLRSNCRDMIQVYNVENMVQNFRSGINTALFEH